MKDENGRTPLHILMHRLNSTEQLCILEWILKNTRLSMHDRTEDHLSPMDFIDKNTQNWLNYADKIKNKVENIFKTEGNRKQAILG